MQNYRRVNAALLWNNSRLDSGDSQWVYCYLLTHPHLTSLGAICMTIADLAAGIHWPIERFQNALNRCMKQNLVVYNEHYALLWLVDFFDHDRLISPEQVMAWQVDEVALPDCPLKENIVARALCEARQVIEFYFNDQPFETDEQLPLFVRVWLQALKAPSLNRSL